METKRCNCCEQVKPLTDFNADSRRADGRQGNCRECARRLVAEWRKANPERSAAHTQNRDPAVAAQYVRTWRARNRDRVRNYKRRFIETTPEKHEAQKLVQRMVKRGWLPGVDTLTCVTCGAPAKHYHHHKGYEVKFWLDVVPMCAKCHAAANGGK